MPIAPEDTQGTPIVLVSEAPSRSSDLEFFSRELLDGSWKKWSDWLERIAKSPEIVEDGYQLAPTPSNVEKCLHLLDRLRESGHPAPTSVHLEPGGGIIIQLVADDRTEEITIWEDGASDLAIYVSGRLEGTVRLSD